MKYSRCFLLQLLQIATKKQNTRNPKTASTATAAASESPLQEN
jgi:hypothetical protein